MPAERNAVLLETSDKHLHRSIFKDWYLGVQKDGKLVPSGGTKLPSFLNGSVENDSLILNHGG